ncbi:hypothetical protein J4471_01590 [Candidatus Woesearchaeota archaeon]|nr:hypothetical protein [Candidatus Woesearchaeota archaeon]
MLNLNKKGDTESVLKFMIGIIIGIIGLFLFFLLFQTILSFFTGYDKCEDSKVMLQFLTDNVNTVTKDKSSLEQLFSLKSGCSLVGFSKSTVNFVRKPDLCGLDSCLCLCEYGIARPNYLSVKCSDSKYYCENIDNIDGFIGQFSTPTFKDQLFIAGEEILNISLQGKNINITVKDKYKFENVIYRG